MKFGTGKGLDLMFLLVVLVSVDVRAQEKCGSDLLTSLCKAVCKSAEDPKCLKEACICEKEFGGDGSFKFNGADGTVKSSGGCNDKPNTADKCVCPDGYDAHNCPVKVAVDLGGAEPTEIDSIKQLCQCTEKTAEQRRGFPRILAMLLAALQQVRDRFSRRQ